MICAAANVAFTLLSFHLLKSNGVVGSYVLMSGEFSILDSNPLFRETGLYDFRDSSNIKSPSIRINSNKQIEYRLDMPKDITLKTNGELIKLSFRKDFGAVWDNVTITTLHGKTQVSGQLFIKGKKTVYGILDKDRMEVLHISSTDSYDLAIKNIEDTFYSVNISGPILIALAFIQMIIFM